MSIKPQLKTLAAQLLTVLAFLSLCIACSDDGLIQDPALSSTPPLVIVIPDTQVTLTPDSNANPSSTPDTNPTPAPTPDVNPTPPPDNINPTPTPDSDLTSTPDSDTPSTATSDTNPTPTPDSSQTPTPDSDLTSTPDSDALPTATSDSSPVMTSDTTTTPNNNYYVRANLGFPFYRPITSDMVSNSANFMVTGNIALGWTKYQFFYPELELGILSFSTVEALQTGSTDTGRLSSGTLFLNFLFSPEVVTFRIKSCSFSFYAGPGVGYALNRMDIEYVSGVPITNSPNYTNNFVFQAMIGSDIAVNNWLSALIDFRYAYLGAFTQLIGAGNVQTNETLNVLSVTIGGKFKF